jgi:hypothetical protein
MEGLGGGESALLPCHILGLAFYALTVLIRMAYTWVSHHPGWSMALAVALAMVLAITHGEKWVVGNTATINGDVADKPLSSLQWYQKGSSGKRILPGNLAFVDMLWGRTQPTTTRADGNKVDEEGLTNNNNQPLMGAMQ